MTGNHEHLPLQRETQVATIAALVDAGFAASFYVDGPAISGPPPVRHAAPDEFAVLGEYRFEGISDPDDEALVLALLHEPTQLRGTLDAAFGPDASAEEAEVLRHLPRRT